MNDTLGKANGPGPRRVALFLASFFGRGVARVRINLCDALLAEGYEVDLVVANGVGELRDSVPEGVNLIDLRASRLIMALPGFYRYIRDRRPAAIISAQDHVNVVALLARKLARSDVPISVSVHNLHTIEANRAWYRRGSWMKYFIRFTYPWATVRVSVSSGLGDVMAETTGLPRDTITTIFNPIVTPRMLENAGAPSPHPWFEDGGAPVILGVGRMTYQKDFSNLIHAVRQVRQTRDVRLMILGSGFLEDDLKSLVAELGMQDVVAIPGYVDNPFAYMSRADLYVLSSVHEGLPGTLIQAMACGCPVVSTDCPHGPREILDAGAYGPLVPIKDSEALAGAIIEALDAPKATPDQLRQRAMQFEASEILSQYRAHLGF